MSQDDEEGSDAEFVEDSEIVANIDYGTALQDQLDYLPFDNDFEIEPTNLILLMILGEGHFGDVHLGLLILNGSKLPVAVKTPKSLLSERMSKMSAVEREQELMNQRESLRDELKIMSFLPGNSNVVKLLGAITTNKDDFCTIIEYCEYGGMDSFLRGKFDNNKFINELIPETDSEGYLKNKYNRLETKDDTPLLSEEESSSWAAEFSMRRDSGHITTSDLLWFALQMARAMSFLTENMVLHRDVALRNVLLKSDFTIRVADFGLSRRAGDDGSYIQHRNVAIPFRYIAPESLRSGRFSPQSESWSFGVVLWELFTFAKQQPYTGLENCDEKTVTGILDYLDTRKRLQIPECTPRNVGSLMTMLWHEDPSQRPTFKTCQETIYEELLQCNPLLLKLEEQHSIARLQPNNHIPFDGCKTEHGKQEVFNENERRKMQRRFRIVAGLAVVLGIICIVSLYLLLRSYLNNSSPTNQLPIRKPPIFRTLSDCPVGLSDDNCLTCICKLQIERCQSKTGNCTEDEESTARGVFKISRDYYIDCGMQWRRDDESIDQAWHRCANNNQCSIECIQNYVKTYSVNCQNNTGCQQISRLHIGGPEGCTASTTISSWKEIEKCQKELAEAELKNTTLPYGFSKNE